MKSKQHSLARFWRLITHDLESDRCQVESFPSPSKPGTSRASAGGHPFYSWTTLKSTHKVGVQGVWECPPNFLSLFSPPKAASYEWMSGLLSCITNLN